MRTRRLAIAALAGVVATALVLPSAALGADTGDYIVVLKDGVTRPAAVAKRHKKKHGADVEHVYRASIKGYAAVLKKKELKALRNDPKVAFITRDGVATTAKRKKPPRGGDGGGSGGAATWGLDRIDERNLPLDGAYDVNGNGTDVTVYIIDTGIRIDHREFGGRASYGYDFVGDDEVANDCNGHGTHVAGTVGGKTYGVATNADLVAVRVLGCGGSGSWSGVIAGIDWVAADASGPSVANLSLSGGSNASVDAAIDALVASGVTVVVAAGNANADACAESPAAAPDALTVGSTTSSDSRSSFSNTGTCVDVFAPGSGIKSAWHTRNKATKTLSGTSMASPHVAGVAALILDASPGASPAQVASALLGDATDGVLSNVGSGSPNRLLYAD